MHRSAGQASPYLQGCWLKYWIHLFASRGFSGWLFMHMSPSWQLPSKNFMQTFCIGAAFAAMLRNPPWSCVDETTGPLNPTPPVTTSREPRPMPWCTRPCGRSAAIMRACSFISSSELCPPLNLRLRLRDRFRRLRSREASEPLSESSTATTFCFRRAARFIFRSNRSPPSSTSGDAPGMANWRSGSCSAGELAAAGEPAAAPGASSSLS
mmetsp:Transcript_49176/g.149715  ORF Transcript_49176/g.149715 Transcript_49176/m.149715 type:complete len:210 (-) Transcript_49176:301-930(-)